RLIRTHSRVRHEANQPLRAGEPCTRDDYAVRATSATLERREIRCTPVFVNGCLLEDSAPTSNGRRWPIAPVDEVRRDDRSRGIAAVGNTKLNGSKGSDSGPLKRSR